MSKATGVFLATAVAFFLFLAAVSADAQTFPITIDPSPLSISGYVVSCAGGEFHSSSANAAVNMSIAPGSCVFNQGGGGGFRTFIFDVTASGTVAYPPSQAGFLSGTGSSTLLVTGHSIVIDTTAQNSQDIQAAGVGAVPSAPTVLHLLPGLHYIGVSSAVELPFRVTENGVVEYPPTFEGQFDGQGTATLQLVGFPIQIDTADLSCPVRVIGGIAPPAQSVFLAQIPSGIYVLTACGGSISFRVDVEGTVAYSSTYEGILEGEGTSTLTVNGIPISVGTPGLLVSGFVVDGVGFVPSGDFQTLNLLPGVYPLVSDNSVFFEVLSNGRVDYPAQFDSILFGRHTDFLAVIGFPVSFDVTAADLGGSTFYSIHGQPVGQPISLSASVSQPLTGNLLPGVYHVNAGVFASGLPVELSFQLLHDGTFDYYHLLDNDLSGRGTNHLSIHGLLGGSFTGQAFPVTVDSSSLSIQPFSVAPTISCCSSFPGGGSTQLSLPSGYYFFYGDGAFEFAVNNNGSVEVLPAFSSFLSGQDTSSLHVLGLPVGLDATGIFVADDLTLVTLAGIHNFVQFPNQPGIVARALPGPHGIAVGGDATWFLTQNGLVDYSFLRQLFLSGQGTTTLTVNGAPLSVDTLGIAPTSLQYVFTGTASRRVITLATGGVAVAALPGLHSVQGGGTDTRSRFHYELTDVGFPDFPLSLNLLASRDFSTRTLRVFGRHMTVDASALSFPSFTVGSNSSVFPTASLGNIRLMPGQHSIVAGGSAEFYVKESGEVEILPSAAAYISGTGGPTTGISTVEVTGLPFTVDATALAPTSSSFSLGGVLSLPTASPASLRLTPFRYAFSASGFPFFRFLASRAGAVDYSPYLDPKLAGRNTNLLRIVVNQPPTADAGDDQVVNCTSPSATSVTLDGSGSVDPDGDALSYSWTGPFPGSPAGGVSPIVSLPLGHSTVSLVVNDGLVDSGPDTVSIRVALSVDGLESPLASLVPEAGNTPLPEHAFQQGKTLPLKLRLACGGVTIGGTQVAAPRIVRLVRSGDAIDLSTIDPDSGQSNDTGLLFRSSESGNWSYNLGTSGLVTGTYVITIEMPDGLRYDAAFVLR